MSIADRPPLIVIAGPTASGKSGLGVAAAEACGGVVVNADASQVYRDIPVLCAAPDESAAEHRLYGFRDGAEPLSAADWAKLAALEIERVHSSGKNPILVGGTGLYLRTLIEGIAPVPQIDAAIRAEVRAATVEDNRDLLERLDPEARVGPNDRARIARALEVVRSTGKPLAEWQKAKVGGIGAKVAVRAIVLTPPRDWLYARCDARFEAMVEGGAIEEVAALLERELDPALPVMRAIGVREIAAFLSGETDRAAMIASGQQSTRRYAKRQYTWFAHQPPADWSRFEEPLDSPGARERALELLGAQR